MTTKSTTPTANSSDREILVSRVFDAPRELVWEAWTNPKHVANWWGPRGFSTTIEVMDVRPGGVWKHVMRGPDGAEYPNMSVFQEVVKPERIVFSHGGAKKGGPGANFVSTWTFEDVGGKTRLTVRMVFATAEERDAVVRNFNAVEGGKQTLERLAGYLPGMESAAPEFVLTRLFDAPRELVWRAFTDPVHLAKWWGPRIVTTPVCEMDVRVGGRYRIVMRMPDGVDYPMSGVFQEVAKPERLVQTVDCAEHPKAWHDLVKPNRAPGEDNPVGEMLQTYTFEEVGGKTKLTIRARFKSAAIRDAMVKMGMHQGWSESLDKLVENLAEVKTPPATVAEFVLTRVFDAPRTLVWKAFTDPEHMKHWWGPKGGNVRAAKMDFRPGGTYLYCMRTPEGQDMWGKFTYREIVPPERLVFINAFSDENGGLTRHPLSATWPR